jgi:hypothetical protein
MNEAGLHGKKCGALAVAIQALTVINLFFRNIIYLSVIYNIY